MSTSHLWLKESSEAAIYIPAHAIALLTAALNYRLLLHYDMHIDPDTVSQHLIQLGIRINVLFLFRSSKLAPETFTAPMTVLCESTSAHSQL